MLSAFLVGAPQADIFGVSRNLFLVNHFIGISTIDVGAIKSMAKTSGCDIDDAAYVLVVLL